jgi:hypothetical protein
MSRSVQVPSHQHKTFDIKPLGECRSCDNYHERVGVTTEQLEQAMQDFMENRKTGLGGMRMLAMLSRVDPATHEKWVGWIAEGVALADAVDEAMGEEWPS